MLCLLDSDEICQPVGCIIAGLVAQVRRAVIEDQLSLRKRTTGIDQPRYIDIEDSLQMTVDHRVSFNAANDLVRLSARFIRM